MDRKILEAIISDTYSVCAEYPFARYPDTAVFRHASNRKWFAAIISVPKAKLGISGKGSLDVVNLKCAQEIIDSMWQETGIFPAYHMNKKHWISVSLDGSVSEETLSFLLGISFELTAK